MKKSIKITFITALVLLITISIMYFSFSSKETNSKSIFDISGLSSKIITEDLSSYFGDHKGCFVLYDRNRDEYYIYNQEKSQERISPASTFNIINSLMGLEEGVIEDEKTVFKWDGRSRDIESWNMDHTMESAFSHSVNWYYQEVAKQLGKERIQELLNDINYGNCDISGGMKKFWMMSSLKISPLEQVEILKRLHAYELPFSHDNIDILRGAMVISGEKNGILSGLSHTADNGMSWDIGYSEISSNVYVFAAYIEGENDMNNQIVKEIRDKILADKQRERRIEKRGKVVYEIPNMEKINVKKDITYKVDGDKKLNLDIYYPLDYKNIDKAPPVILIHGATSDNNFKDKKYFTSWGRLIAASGHPVITFNWRYHTTPEDISDLVTYVREHGDELNIDKDGISVIAFSAGVEDGVRQTLSVNTGFIDGIVAYYGNLPLSLLDIPQEKGLPPMFIAKAGRDSYFSSDCNNEFINKAVDLGWDVTEVVHIEGKHGFDVYDDNQESYKIIKKSIDFINNNR